MNTIYDADGDDNVNYCEYQRILLYWLATTSKISLSLRGRSEEDNSNLLPPSHISSALVLSSYDTTTTTEDNSNLHHNVED